MFPGDRLCVGVDTLSCTCCCYRAQCPWSAHHHYDRLSRLCTQESFVRQKPHPPFHPHTDTHAVAHAVTHADTPRHTLDTYTHTRNGWNRSQQQQRQRQRYRQGLRHGEDVGKPTALQVSALREVLQQTRAPDETHQNTHGRKAPPVQLPWLLQAFFEVGRVDKTLEDPLEPAFEAEHTLEVDVQPHLPQQQRQQQQRQHQQQYPHVEQHK